MRHNRLVRVQVALLGSLALVLSGCTTVGEVDGERDDAPGPAESVTVAVERGWDAYNSDVAGGRGPWNFTVDNVTKSRFWDYGPDGAIVPNPAFGSYEKVGDDPLTVRYDIHPDAVWSDGEPIDYADALLDWAARAGGFRTGEGDDAAPLFQAVRPLNGQPAMPDGQPGDKSFTIVYDQPIADWRVAFEGFLPAHVAAAQAGLSSAELVEAIQQRDVETLVPVAEFWNTGWIYTADTAVPDPDLVPSSGPYRLSHRDGSALIVVRNEAYWGEPATLETIVFRTLDPSEHAQALVNGEVDVIEPQPLLDVYQQLSGTAGIEVLTSDQFAFVHLDFNMESPLFEDLAARQAFALCIPRQRIVETLVAPLNPQAQVMNLREFFPFQPEYEAVLAMAPTAGDYDEVDLVRAAQLIDQAGLDDLAVQLVVADNDRRLTEAASLITNSCAEVGFTVDWQVAPSLGERLSGGQWDAVMFQWASPGLLGLSPYFYGTGQLSNFGKYSNPVVDDLVGEIAVTDDLDRLLVLKGELEEQLWQDVFNVPLYAQPRIVAVSDRIDGVVSHVWPAGLTLNAAQWSVRS